MVRKAMIWIALVIGAFVIVKLDEFGRARQAPTTYVPPTNNADSYVGVAGGDCENVLGNADETLQMLKSRMGSELMLDTPLTTLPDGTRYFVVYYAYSDGQRKMFYVGSSTYLECRRLSARYGVAAGL